MLCRASVSFQFVNIVIIVLFDYLPDRSNIWHSTRKIRDTLSFLLIVDIN